MSVSEETRYEVENKIVQTVQRAQEYCTSFRIRSSTCIVSTWGNILGVPVRKELRVSVTSSPIDAVLSFKHSLKFIKAAGPKYSNVVRLGA
jgi:hypothetical protein